MIFNLTSQDDKPCYDTGMMQVKPENPRFFSFKYFRKYLFTLLTMIQIIDNVVADATFFFLPMDWYKARYF